ncbi:MAG TPA: hypothetical protein VFJ30_05435 [Phycisphaerae bacterium]|nr:hypothetical protein [Phycisphaerae bacterium]
MSNELDELLYRAAEDSVASLAFTLLVERQGPDHAPPGANGQSWAAEAAFAGPVSGKVVLVADDAVLTALAEHMRCLPRIGNRKPEAFRRLLRTVCDHLLCELAVGDTPGRVHPPRILGRIGPLDALSGPHAAGARLDLADGTLELALFIHRYSANGRSSPSMAALRH